MDPARGGARSPLENRLAVIDCGSNSFRLVVFTSTDAWWKRTDEIHESVRVGEGLDATGALQEAPMERALETLDLYAHFCDATGIDAIRPVATSAIRDASNQKQFLRAATKRSGLDIEVLSGEQEAHYGYLAAVNSTTLSQGVVLDLGGGSMQLTRVENRQSIDGRSWPLGAVRMTERFLPDAGKPKRKQLKALRDHVLTEIESAAWLDEGGRLTGVGGTVRNLAAAAQLAAGLPSYGIQGFRITRDALGQLIETFAGLTPAERANVPGIKFARADLILAGAQVIDTVMEAGGFGIIEATDAGLREGVFFESLLGDPPLVDDVRRATVLNLAAQYDADFAHAEHVAQLSLELWDGLAAADVHRGDPKERELLWATAMLHDIGTAVDYDDHHKHSRYLILSAGMPGYSPREVALIGQAARYHRKGNPGLGEFTALARPGDEELLNRIAAAVRIAEQLERSRDQAVRACDVLVKNGRVELRLHAEADVTIARWATERQGDVFRKAFGRDLSVT
jgi:exopolyphosphatase/guanosine-5'-triphosphate,3'-diphosphate pyrophosphatase